jgi:hypothetical protein
VTFSKRSSRFSKTIPLGNSLLHPSADPSDGAEGYCSCQIVISQRLIVEFVLVSTPDSVRFPRAHARASQPALSLTLQGRVPRPDRLRPSGAGVSPQDNRQSKRTAIKDTVWHADACQRVVVYRPTVTGWGEERARVARQAVVVHGTCVNLCFAVARSRERIFPPLRRSPWGGVQPIRPVVVIWSTVVSHGPEGLNATRRAAFRRMSRRAFPTRKRMKSDHG